MKSLIDKIRRHILSLRIHLKLTNKVDLERFTSVYKQAVTKYKNSTTGYSFKSLLMPEWAANAEEIGNYFLNGFDTKFLRHPLLKSTMFAHLPSGATAIQKKFILQYFGIDKAKNYLVEESLGKPILNDMELLTSGNSLHHLYHLAKFSKETGTNLEKIKTIVEWGGGYGNLVKIFKRIVPDVTYIIIDIPIFAYIQYVYLSYLFGTEIVHIYQSGENMIPGKIYLVPLDDSNLASLSSQSLNPDLFVSTWALSESNETSQTLVKNADYFGARNLLLAYQQANESFQYAQKVTSLNQNYVVSYNEQTEYMPNNYYLFAKRK